MQPNRFCGWTLGGCWAAKIVLQFLSISFYFEPRLRRDLTVLLDFPFWGIQFSCIMRFLFGLWWLFCFLLWSCKSGGGGSGGGKTPATQPGQPSGSWLIVNVFDVQNNREYNLSGAPFSLSITENRLTIHLDKNTCNAGFEWQAESNELAAEPLGCTRMCCDGEAGSRLAALMNEGQSFGIEAARGDMVLWKSRRLHLRLRPDTLAPPAPGKPDELPKNLAGTWFFNYYSENDRIVRRFPARRYWATFAAAGISVRRDVNTCNQSCSYTPSEIVCPEQGMSCTKICCDEDASAPLALFSGRLTWSIEEGNLLLRQGNREWALLR